jgi:hypothetical protein
MRDLQDAPDWEKRMRTAREVGKRDHPKRNFTSRNGDDIAAKIAELERIRERHGPVPVREINGLVDQMVGRFETCDVDASPDAGHQQVRIGALIYYAREHVRARRASIVNEINSNYGDQDVAPTRMGNIANSIQSYVLRRYHCNFEAVWSNLQHAMSKDDKAQAVLQETKAQLDFLIAASWLTLISSLIWTAIFGLSVPSRGYFPAVAIGGPLIAYLWYRAATEQYRSFADVTMTMFDTFRFALLGEMHLPAPADVEDERSLWENVNHLTAYGEAINLRYDRPKT